MKQKCVCNLIATFTYMIIQNISYVHVPHYQENRMVHNTRCFSCFCISNQATVLFEQDFQAFDDANEDGRLLEFLHLK